MSSSMAAKMEWNDKNAIIAISNNFIYYLHISFGPKTNMKMHVYGAWTSVNVHAAHQVCEMKSKYERI